MRGGAELLQDGLLALLASRSGHFVFESGHHGELWLDLDRLFLRPARLAPFIADLAERLSKHRIEAVCGPALGGTLVAAAVATTLDVEFYPSERKLADFTGGLFEAEYRLPDSLREAVRGRHVAIVDDVINAGSATRATWKDLEACGAEPVAIGALLTLGRGAEALAEERKVPLETIATLSNDLWTPERCPLCERGQPLKRLA